MKRIHLILTGLSATIVLLSFNRLTSFTQGFLQPFDYLRTMDFLAMLPIPLFSVLLYWLLRNEVVSEGSFKNKRLYIILDLLLISGIYFFAAGSGDHEVTNYLNFRFCEAGRVQTPICQIIGYNDDKFSHYIYYIGFVLMNITLMFLEFNNPRKTAVKIKDFLFISINSLFIALGIFANLAFEEALLDLFFFGGVMILGLYLLFSGKHKYNQLPVIFYFACAYTLGVVGTILYKFLSGTPF